MPPVASASRPTSPPVMAESTSARNELAISCFELSKALRLASAILSFFAGLLDGLLVGEGGVAISESLSSKINRFFRAVMGVFRGEYSSFQSLMTSWLQNASMLGRCGVGGMRNFLGGDCNLDFEGLDGGVTLACLSPTFDGDLKRGGELSLSDYRSCGRVRMLTTSGSPIYLQGPTSLGH